MEQTKDGITSSLAFRVQKEGKKLRGVSAGVYFSRLCFKSGSLLILRNKLAAIDYHLLTGKTWQLMTCRLDMEWQTFSFKYVTNFLHNWLMSFKIQTTVFINFLLWKPFACIFIFWQKWVMGHFVLGWSWEKIAVFQNSKWLIVIQLCPMFRLQNRLTLINWYKIPALFSSQEHSWFR